MASGKVVLGVLAGAAIGALAGILFAPEKGSRTRKKISKRGEDYVDSLREKFDDFLEGITDKFEAAKEEAVHFVEKEKPKSHAVIEKATNGKP